MMNNEEIKKIKNLFSEKKEIVIIPHKNPDGDAIGSSTALKYFLEKYDHNISIISPNDFPKFLKWMDYKNEIEVFSENNKCIEKLLNADVIFTLDFNTLKEFLKLNHILRNLKRKLS